MTLRILSVLTTVMVTLTSPLAATVSAQTTDANPEPLLLSRPLYIGVSGSDVADLQRFLKTEGLFSHPRITGFFGTITKDSVTRFQNNNGIDPIGEVGPLTRLALTIRSLQKILAHIGPANSLAAVGPLASTTSATSTIVSATSTPVVPIYRGGGGGSVDTTTAPSTVDSAAPVISSISADKTSTTATTSWTTDEAANSQVNYGTTISYGTASSSAALATSHAITLSGLTDNTIYHFQVQSVDAQGNTAASSDQTFTTDSWTPTELGSAVVGWYDETSLVVSDGKVTQWTDLSGAGNHLVQSNSSKQPAYDATGYSGIPTPVFDGVATYLQRQSLLSGEQRLPSSPR